ncbi:MAG: hypothetical protein FWD42_04570, partial [Solirubrobacterales bacterium]|nr:hypothetical protein [Solirubrobacterales bacterium]
MALEFSQRIAQIPVYPAAEGYAQDGSVARLASNESPYPPLDAVREAIARELGKLGVVWSCNAKANVPRATLKVMGDNGLRLLLVGYESGNQQILHNIKKGMRVDVAKRFAKDCRELGIRI